MLELQDKHRRLVSSKRYDEAGIVVRQLGDAKRQQRSRGHVVQAVKHENALRQLQQRHAQQMRVLLHKQQAELLKLDTARKAESALRMRQHQTALTAMRRAHRAAQSPLQVRHMRVPPCCCWRRNGGVIVTTFLGRLAPVWTCTSCGANNNAACVIRAVPSKDKRVYQV